MGRSGRADGCLPCLEQALFDPRRGAVPRMFADYRFAAAAAQAGAELGIVHHGAAEILTIEREEGLRGLGNEPSASEIGCGDGYGNRTFGTGDAMPYSLHPQEKGCGSRHLPSSTRRVV